MASAFKNKALGLAVMWRLLWWTRLTLCWIGLSTTLGECQPVLGMKIIVRSHYLGMYLVIRVAQPQLATDLETLRRATFADDDYFPSISLIYKSDWLAETFQLRLAISETAIRPDLREVTDSSYQDPMTNELVNGNPDVVPSSVENIDLRAEWFFANGNNLTISLFNKEISDPIEYFESPASDTNTAREIINASETSIQGLEIDGVLALGFVA